MTHRMLSPHFSLVEFICRDGTPVPEDLVPNVQRLAEQLEALRAIVGPVRVSSGYRSPAHNEALRAKAIAAGRKPGAAKDSQHMHGRAADLVVAGMTPEHVAAIIAGCISAGTMQDGGLGVYGGWVHYDCWKPRRWRG